MSRTSGPSRALAEQHEDGGVPAALGRRQEAAELLAAHVGQRVDQRLQPAGTSRGAVTARRPRCSATSASISSSDGEARPRSHVGDRGPSRVEEQRDGRRRTPKAAQDRAVVVDHARVAHAELAGELQPVARRCPG